MVGRRLGMALAIVTIVSAYCVSFMVLSKTIVLTGIVSEGPRSGETVSIRLIYFSAHPRVNKCLYYAYCPSIYINGGDANIVERVNGGVSIRSLEVNPRLATTQDPIYVYDVTVVYDTGLFIEK